MFGIPEKELKETLAHADVTLLAAAHMLTTAQQTLLDVQAVVAKATALLTEIERSGVTIVVKAGS